MASLANMIEIFNAKIAEFNKSIEDGDRSAMSEIGTELFNIAFQECSKTNVPDSVKNFYKKQCNAVLNCYGKLLLASNKPLTNNNSREDDEENSDPYYVTKKWFSDEVPNLSFKDIIGVQEVKNAFMVDVVAPLRPELKHIYKKFRGEQVGTQILLYGPPGTGKTHIVKCLAGALNCKIAVVQTSEILASVVGVAEKNMRDVFAQASELDRCIIFLDEIDSLCSDRSSDDSRNTKSVLTTMLTCMDGFIKNTKPNQYRIIIAATNLPWRLDAALKRGGRFENQIYVPLPDQDAREKFVTMDLSRIPHDENVTASYLAKKLEGYSGADIKAIMRQIANKPLKREVQNVLSGNKETGERVTLSDCEEVIKNYINVITPEMELQFEAYKHGIDLEDYLKIKGLKK